MKAKKTQPYIGYDKATFLTQLHDFINRANRMRKDAYTQLDFMSRSLATMQMTISEMKQWFSPVENPSGRCGKNEDDIEALRDYAWDLGLTKTLFEKLNGQWFRNRFTGLGSLPPVLKEEIEDRYGYEENA